MDAHHRVAPGLCAEALHVAKRDIHAADIAHAPVEDSYLAMVAVVDLAGEGRKADGHEGVDLHPTLTHPLIEAGRDAPAAHVVVDDAHLHALGSLGDQGVAHEAPQGVVLEEEEVEVDMVAGRGDVAEQLGENS